MSTSTVTTQRATPPATPASALVRGVRRLAALAGNSMLQKSALAVLDQAVVSGTSFFTSVILARMCAKEELGVYYLALSIVLVVRGIQEQLVTVPYMIYSGRREGEALARYTGSSLAHQCTLLAVTSLILAAVAPLGILPQGLQSAIWLLLCAAPLLLMREYIRQLMFTHLAMRAALTLDTAAALVQLLGLSALMATGALSLTTTLAVLAIAAGLPAACWLVMKRQPMIVGLRDALDDFLHNWIFARWALASQLLASTTPYVMPWIVAWTHGEAQTGTLGACSTLVGLSNMFMMGLCNFLSPKAARAFASGGVAELKSVLRTTALMFAATLGTICFVGFVLGERIAVWVYGPQFGHTGWLIGILSLSVLANSMGVTAGNGLWAMERPNANFFADLFSLGVVIVATIVLVPPLGPLGAALATLSGTSSDAAVRLWVLRLTMRELAGPRRTCA